MYKFDMHANACLKHPTTGYHNTYYTKFKKQGNPDFLTALKNTFNSTAPGVLRTAREEVTRIVLNDLPSILKKRLCDRICICVPRAKKITFYSDTQLMFAHAVQIAIDEISSAFKISYAKDCIIRVHNTYTTHFKKAIPNYTNDGDKPYPGITVDTCEIDRGRIEGQNILLIDDIYVSRVNTAEDCIQALYDHGANHVVFYAIAFMQQ